MVGSGTGSGNLTGSGKKVRIRNTAYITIVTETFVLDHKEKQSLINHKLFFLLIKETLSLLSITNM